MTPELQKQLGEADTIETVVELLSEHQNMVLTGRDVDIVCKTLDRIGQQTTAKVAILSNYTTNPLDKYIRAESARLGIAVETYTGPYGQCAQEILDPRSDLHAFKPDVILLTLTLEQLSPSAHYSFAEISEIERVNEVKSILETIDSLVGAARKSTDALLLISNFEGPAGKAFGFADGKEPYSEAEFYAELNLGLLRAYRKDMRVHILDLNDAVARFGRDRAYSQRMYHLAKMLWSADFLSCFAAEFGNFLVAATGRTAKCVVLDLDNTLWGGIVGEDGPQHVRIGNGDPISEAYLSFQHALKSLKHRGIILAVCSKNNEEDIREVFEIRNEMPLKLEDFSAKQINWDNKHENLIRIAQDLNIGTESLVFIDDNPVECAMVRKMLPEIRIIALPSDPADYVTSIRNFPYFQKLTVTEEDKNKYVQYRDNARRQEAKRDIGDLNAFLESLATKLKIFHAESRHATRIHQLFTKTSQFNVTTKRYTPADIESFLAKSDFELWLVDVSDRYGDLGIVGLYLLEFLDKTIRIDSFILSCRAMGRGIETAIINTIKQDYLFSRKFDCLEAGYIRTAKNEPAATFYENQGFDVLDCTTSEQKTYRLQAERAAILPCPGIEFL